ncbi:MAG TPA: polymer-forming cytoskeletal protein [Polyangiaceae bacterium LLY-WYZ-15_(1-7)]|nr:polymer-forming cytoskeletal protein [Polyangiaceae bacterium LLY-WYZ-15_(1-7)]HJL00615.1 polymer-forming cytoskeletal protein [Polyangiaceae bacterium LLY-WYZ-15_(1-7)]HJL13185.1 polymer-forming cytoskeletal protein [Polyangiaceae bacterium LLY-WYZ-15_(1-7)]HJL26616.1 polymer-forming cytoskeletal protein [Polyangiaceae bacterium LLY-WYZ-15_(1-7)]HJL29421.1 polymer-forming cytoskeletal protein [Polyangiaceae bacterium LLY-WYZ-15_(1-7)]
MTSKDLTPAPGEISALLGRGTEYSGRLTFEGRVRIDGRFDGAIFSEGMLIVGEGAEIEADIDVGTLIVLGGRVKGGVRARKLVELHAPCHVIGDIETPQIFIDRGVLFEGQCHMLDGAPTERHSLDGKIEEALRPASEPAQEAPVDDEPAERGPEADELADADADADGEAPAEGAASAASEDGEDGEPGEDGAAPEAMGEDERGATGEEAR